MPCAPVTNGFYLYVMLLLLHFPTALLPEYSTVVSTELFIRLVLGLWGKIIRLCFASNSLDLWDHWSWSVAMRLLLKWRNVLYGSGTFSARVVCPHDVILSWHRVCPHERIHLSLPYS